MERGGLGFCFWGGGGSVGFVGLGVDVGVMITWLIGLIVY